MKLIINLKKAIEEPFNFSTVTVSGTAVNLTKNDLLKGVDTLNLGIRTKISKDEARTGEFNFSRMVI